MHISLLSIFVFLLFSLRVVACEDECPPSICKAVLGNYSDPVKHATHQIARDIERRGLVARSNSLQRQLASSYLNCSYTTLYDNMFPGFFHGKCQDPTTGIDPPGCPDPDCPVVCGTPGSICHFYSQFRQIAFNATVVCLAQAVKEVAKRHHSNTATEPRTSPSGRSIIFAKDDASVPHRRSEAASGWSDVEEQIPVRLMAICGGSSLSYCDPETAMRAYILSFN
ncbi:hypothetical protein DFH07DRAFT_1063657 [Mycena maculata]|uniref:Uncharacterized protein n=1 Tax=Mycena maculata TaxID=230809 RepID=A0AAD7IJ52_9AGAR|nr:hypothetical protein DFH07DRAFT_1063657 [Mycena maculata]